MAKTKEKKPRVVPAKPYDIRDTFIRRLAEYLAKDQARKSIELQMGKESAKEWAALRCATPLMGYPSVDKAEILLRRFLLGE